MKDGDHGCGKEEGKGEETLVSAAEEEEDEKGEVGPGRAGKTKSKEGYAGGGSKASYGVPRSGGPFWVWWSEGVDCFADSAAIGAFCNGPVKQRLR